MAHIDLSSQPCKIQATFYVREGQFLAVIAPSSQTTIKAHVVADNSLPHRSKQCEKLQISSKGVLLGFPQVHFRQDVATISIISEAESSAIGSPWATHSTIPLPRRSKALT